MKHRHRKEKKRFGVVPTTLEVQLLGAKCKYFVACRCGAIFHEGKWVDDSEIILEITGQHKFMVARTMIPYEKLTWKD